MTHALEDSKMEKKLIKAAVYICTSKKLFLRISRYSRETPVLESLPERY